MVLVVDDEEEVRRVLVKMLSRLGFAVIEAEHGEQGLELFRTHREEVVLVILDLTMPGLDGEATLKALRKIDGSVKTVVMSGYSEGDIAARLAGLDVSMILAKPFSMKLLREKLMPLVDSLSPATS